MNEKIKQFIKDNKATIELITEANPTISRDDEWRENNEWNNYCDNLPIQTINDKLNMYRWIITDMALELSKTEKYKHMIPDEIIQDWINEWILD